MVDVKTNSVVAGKADCCTVVGKLVDVLVCRVVSCSVDGVGIPVVPVNDCVVVVLCMVVSGVASD